MTLEETTELYASVLRQLLPVGGYDTSPNTEALAVDIYAHAKLLAQADLDAKRLLNVLEGIPSELINEYEAEYGLPLKCTVNASRTVEERLQILNWVRTSRNVLNRAYLEQILAIFGVVLIDVVKFKPLLCTASCNSPVNTEQMRYKVFLRLQYPMNADLNCIIENYLPGYLRFDWMIDMPWGDWILNSGVTVSTNGIAHYTAYKTNQREYYDSYANLDLTTAIVLSLSDTDMQQWQAVRDACNQLTGVTDWYFDTVNECVSYTQLPTSSNGAATEYDAFFYSEISSATSGYRTPELSCEATAAFSRSSSNGDYLGYYFTHIAPNYDPANGANGCIGTAYNKYSGENYGAYSWAVYGKPNPNYNPNAITPTLTKTFLEIAIQIISNISSSNEAISLLAEVYLEAVANSIYNADESKQFVKLSDLLSQLELNKTLRH